MPFSYSQGVVQYQYDFWPLNAKSCKRDWKLFQTCSRENLCKTGYRRLHSRTQTSSTLLLHGGNLEWVGLRVGQSRAGISSLYFGKLRFEPMVQKDKFHCSSAFSSSFVILCTCFLHHFVLNTTTQVNWQLCWIWVNSNLYVNSHCSPECIKYLNVNNNAISLPRKTHGKKGVFFA